MTCSSEHSAVDTTADSPRSYGKGQTLCLFSAGYFTCSELGSAVGLVMTRLAGSTQSTRCQLSTKWKPLPVSMLVFRGLCGTGLSFRGFIVAPRLTTAGKPEGALESAEMRDKVLGRKNGLRVPLCSAGAHRSGCHCKFTTRLCKLGDLV